jgi:pyruvate kinase
MVMNNKTLILATLGPSFCQKEDLKQAILMGITLFRQPFGYRNQAHLEQIKLIRELSDELSVNCQVVTDLPSNRLRIGKLFEPEIQFNAQDIVEVVDKLESTESFIVPIPGLKSIIHLLEKDSQIFIRDGNIKLKIMNKDNDRLYCKIIQASQKIKSNNNTHFPAINYDLDLITSDDISILKDYYKNSIFPDWIAISFVKNANDINKSSQAIYNIFNKKIKIMAKIETTESLKNIKEIAEVSEGIMVARGDMGIILPIEQVPYFQKIILQNGKNFGKPVVVATQMMENFADTEIANRAEISDVFTAVHQGAYAVMLSRETSGSKNPLSVLKMMKRIVDFSNKIKRNTPSLDGRNLIIAIEGIDGSGKTTIAKRLSMVIDATYVSTPPAPFKDHQNFFEENEREILARFFYYLGSLWESWRYIEVESGKKIVLLDRYLLSTKIYHEVLLSERDLTKVYIVDKAINTLAPPAADINILLEVSEEFAIERLKNKKQKQFDENLEKNRNFQDRLAEKFRLESDFIINTNNKSVEEIVAECVNIINKFKQKEIL